MATAHRRVAERGQRPRCRGARDDEAPADGAEQVTYHGHPLYTYAADGSAAGSTKGEGLNAFGGKWYAVDGTGKAVEPAGTGSEMGGGRGGYGY